MKGIRFLKDDVVVEVFLGADCLVKARDAKLVRGVDYDVVEHLVGGAFDTWVTPATPKKI